MKKKKWIKKIKDKINTKTSKTKHKAMSMKVNN